jgi:hypothetical protein
MPSMRLRSTIAAVILFCMQSAHSAESASNRAGALSQQEALRIARQLAIDAGEDPKQFQLDKFVSHKSDDGKKWIFHFFCAPNPPPDCGFFVEVDIQTRQATMRQDF